MNISNFYNKTVPYVNSLAAGTPIAMISTRRLSSTYTGFILKVRRGSDNIEKDFYADKFGNIRDGVGGTSGTTLYTWLNGATGYVTTWYDQSGNGYNWTQPTTTSQPIIEFIDNFSKVLINMNGRYMLGSSSFNTNNTILTLNPYYIFEYDYGFLYLFHRGNATVCHYEPTVNTNNTAVSGCSGTGVFTNYTSSSARTNILMVKPDAGTTLTRLCQLNGNTINTTGDRTLTPTGYVQNCIGAAYNSTSGYILNNTNSYIRSILIYNSAANITDVLTFLNQYCNAI